jgi:hypothetical protein
MALIDLDRPPTPPEPARPPGRSRWAVGALALLLAGAAIGGAAVYRAQRHRIEDERRSVAAIVMLPDLRAAPGEGVTPTVAVGGQAVEVGFNGLVDVVNAGPAPVRFAGFRAEPTGGHLRGFPAVANLTIPAGESIVATFYADVRCDTDPLARPLPVGVDVVTADGVHRTATVSLDGRAWTEAIETACAQAWNRR